MQSSPVTHRAILKTWQRRLIRSFQIPGDREDALFFVCRCPSWNNVGQAGRQAGRRASKNGWHTVEICRRSGYFKKAICNVKRWAAGLAWVCRGQRALSFHAFLMATMTKCVFDRVLLCLNTWVVAVKKCCKKMSMGSICDESFPSKYCSAGNSLGISMNILKKVFKKKPHVH